VCIATDFFFAAIFSFLSNVRGYTEHLLSRPLKRVIIAITERGELVKTATTKGKW